MGYSGLQCQFTGAYDYERRMDTLTCIHFFLIYLKVPLYALMVRNYPEKPQCKEAIEIGTGT